jgi:hypothetical protein
MTPKRDHSKEKRGDATKKLSRRNFLKLGAGGLAALAGGALTGCRLVAPDPAPTYAPIPTAELQPSSQPPPTWTPTPPEPTPLPPDYTAVPATPTSPPVPTSEAASAPSRAALMAHWPETDTSRVVLVRNGSVWDDDTPNPAAVLQMLDTGIDALADTSDALAVWRALFDPSERVLLKVNCIAYGGPTQPAVTYAVAQRLQDAGLAAENILIFDRTDHELESAGYTLNEGGPGVQCHGTRGDGSEAALSQATVRFYQEFDAYDAIINIPTPKEHGTAGISVSMKNHYGSINRPGALHGGRCDPAIAELNAQPIIRKKTRLMVGAALKVSPADWNRPEREDALLLSFDPVALDTVARDILVRHRQEKGMSVDSLIKGAPQLSSAQSLGLGATGTELIDLREVAL